MGSASGLVEGGEIGVSMKSGLRDRNNGIFGTPDTWKEPVSQ